MNPTLEFSYATAIVVVLLGLAGYFGRRQIQTLRGLKNQENLASEDRRYVRNQAILRLSSCVLMVAFAGMLAGAYLTNQQRRAVELGEQRQAADAPLNPEEKAFARQLAAYWIVMLLILLVIVLLAFFDLYAIRTYGRRHYRKIRDDRRAMIERQVAILRSQRTVTSECRVARPEGTPKGVPQLQKSDATRPAQ